MDMEKIELASEIDRCEKEFSAYEYEYDHTADADKRASLVKSIDFWSERTADAYHRLALCEEDDDLEDDAYSEHSIFDRIDAESSEAEEMTEDEIEELFSESKAGGYYD